MAWSPPEIPDDGVARMFRVYGYRDTGDPDHPLGESLGQRGVGTPDADCAIALRDFLAKNHPEHRWVVEWRLL
jgi:hypothetical protein